MAPFLPLQTHACPGASRAWSKPKVSSACPVAPKKQPPDSNKTQYHPFMFLSEPPRCRQSPHAFTLTRCHLLASRKGTAQTCSRSSSPKGTCATSDSKCAADANTTVPQARVTAGRTHRLWREPRTGCLCQERRTASSPGNAFPVETLRGETALGSFLQQRPPARTQHEVSPCRDNRPQGPPRSEVH